MNHVCLACGQMTARMIMDLGNQPAANLLSLKPNAPVQREHLALRFCDSCSHGQQDFYYAPENLFDNYLYQSGTSRTLNDYFSWFAENLREESSGDISVLEIASNDGSLLTALKQKLIDAHGMEPAANLVEVSRARGCSVSQGYWPDLQSTKQYDRIIAMNVLAHVTRPFEFLQAIHERLTSSGVAYIQVSQADMFKNYEFDTLYHEHYSFFCPYSLTALAQRCGFKNIRLIKTDIHGGSILAVLGNSKTTIEHAFKKMNRGHFSLGSIPTDDRPTSEQADIFDARKNEFCSSLSSIVELGRQGNKKIILVGVSAKATTVLQTTNLDIDYVVDEADLKIGKFIPGTDHQIRSISFVSSIKASCLFIMGAWNFKDELSMKLARLRPPGDFVLSYFPHIVLTPLKSLPEAT